MEALGLCSKYSTTLATPAEKLPLPRDAYEVPYDGPISYASVVGMLLYLLTGHSRPDCPFAIHQRARYTFEPKRSYIATLKGIGRYLKGIAGKGFVLDPPPGIGTDCYPDAEFVGLLGYEDPQDDHCARSHTAISAPRRMSSFLVILSPEGDHAVDDGGGVHHPQHRDKGPPPFCRSHPQRDCSLLGSPRQRRGRAAHARPREQHQCLHPRWARAALHDVAFQALRAEATLVSMADWGA
ncbi:hypothetical protein ACHAWF_000551 [Thalassiosira exigua]